MQSYKMIVKTETLDEAGKLKRTTETVPNLIEAELNDRREAARLSAPQGATRTIRVVSQR